MIVLFVTLACFFATGTPTDAPRSAETATQQTELGRHRLRGIMQEGLVEMEKLERTKKRMNIG